ncbi:prepilin-type N-terminal cleavage/methylation domain-containing protein [Candidatus Sumerlaeota bacterium]|nr:prepilin-type N-terminal cleavage/methylation domain-containing protein [Candidatus Sumerlaeota bacterium]MBI3737372.1 prepilin-type N-terminal cleavage/methylation domain-containing protein [Candidatus Sumerlaeota bacterium]
MKVFRKIKGFTLVEIMIVVAIIGILIAIAVPGFIRARSMSRMKSCQENLTKIDGAKEQWALENNKSPGATVNQSDIIKSNSQGYLKGFPNEPSGGTYTIGAVGSDPTCSTGYPGHSLAQVGQAITDLESAS